MKMPNADRAVVEMAKLTEYCLNPTHPRGRHKARPFQSALGISALEGDLLRETLIHVAKSDNAIPGGRDEYGQRYAIDFEMIGPGGRATVRSAWIVRADEDFPRFVSCYVH